MQQGAPDSPEERKSRDGQENSPLCPEQQKPVSLQRTYPAFAEEDRLNAAQPGFGEGEVLCERPGDNREEQTDGSETERRERGGEQGDQQDGIGPGQETLHPATGEYSQEAAVETGGPAERHP